MTDIVVLGAGTAGSVLTRRLLDAGFRVSLVEAGGADDNPAIHDLSRVGELWFGPEDWRFHTVPQVHALERRLHLPRGKVVGGSNQLNGVICRARPRTTTAGRPPATRAGTGPPSAGCSTASSTTR